MTTSIVFATVYITRLTLYHIMFSIRYVLSRFYRIVTQYWILLDDLRSRLCSLCKLLMFRYYLLGFKTSWCKEESEPIRFLCFLFILLGGRHCRRMGL